MKRGTASRVVIGGNTMLDLPKGLVFGTDVILGGIAGLTSDFNGLVLSNTLMLGKKISHISVITVIVRGQSPLNLPYAIANSLSYVKAFGGTGQGGVPSGYTLLNGVANGSGTYIDTGITPAVDNVEIEIRVKPTTGSWYILQSRASGGTIWGVSGSSSGTTILLGWAGTGNLCQSSINRDPTHTYYVKATMNNGTATLYVKDETDNTEDTNTATYTSAVPSLPFWLYGNQNGHRVNSGNTVYMARIKVGGVTVMDYVPALNPSTVVGFYDKITGNFKVSDAGTLTADQTIVPTPDTPMDIVSNNGVLKVRQNIWKGNYTDLGYLDSNGVVVPTAGYMASDFIEIDQSKKYTFYEQILSTYAGNGMRICFYNSNKQMVGQRQGDSAIDIGDYAYIATPPANAKYIRVSTGVSTGYVTDITLVEGEYNTTTIQGVVGSIYTDGTVETINVHGKNLFDEQWNRNTGVSTQTATWGQVVTASGWSTSALIPVKAGQEYTISYNTGVQLYVFYYESDGTMQQSYDTTTSTKKTFTVPAGATHIRLQVNKSTEAQIAELKSQLETGATATAYVAYYNGGTATAEMLLKVGDYQDVQSILDGVVTRNVGVKVLDGTETYWKDQISNNGRVFIRSADINCITVYSRYADYFCSHFLPTTAGSPLPGSTAITAAGMFFWVQSNITTLTEWTDWLAAQYAAGTPVIVIYPLDEPTTESVAGQTMNVQEGNNILEITQASMDGLELEASYDTGVVAIIQEVQDVNLNNNVTVTIE